ncbi:hypothetical protein [Saccharothrix syringae]|uniref:Uncharacterized protein n=1 Tax=Saccharothrix syringae TaxID=103733 RepID=A0A5Q0H1V5_SACSY|nr:hypothetical protein [Saccharothrix syringae]QFZ20109.1 hypothetical protein EKG83_24215 [Saccharothrix syringae]
MIARIVLDAADAVSADAVSTNIVSAGAVPDDPARLVEHVAPVRQAVAESDGPPADVPEINATLAALAYAITAGRYLPADGRQSTLHTAPGRTAGSTQGEAGRCRPARRDGGRVQRAWPQSAETGSRRVQSGRTAIRPRS